MIPVKPPGGAEGRPNGEPVSPPPDVAVRVERLLSALRIALLAEPLGHRRPGVEDGVCPWGFGAPTCIWCEIRDALRGA